MIKLKHLLMESDLFKEQRKLDLSKKKDVAEYLIRRAWKLMSGEDDETRYNLESVLLWIDNDRELSDEAWKLSKKFYPTSEEPWYEFQEELKQVLIELDRKRLEKRKSKNPSLADPLYLLKKLMVGKSWKAVKYIIANQFAGRYNTRNVPDEDAEQMFNRLYKIAMGETVYNKKEIEDWGFGYLGSLSIQPVESSNNEKQYVINGFLRHYGLNHPYNQLVRVWRGTNNPHAKIRPGDFVTFERGYAQGYLSGKHSAIITDVLNSNDLLLYKADPGMSEMVYWPKGHEIQKYEGKIPSLREFWEQYRLGI